MCMACVWHVYRRVLQRDEPHTAHSLLHPNTNESLPLPPAAKGTPPLSTAR